MKFLIFGDIMGKIGRKALQQVLPSLKKKYKPDLIIANAENLAHGVGVTEKTAKELREAGVQIFTSGNHIWAKPEINDLFQNPSWQNILLRPANYPPSLPGRGETTIKIKNREILIINLCGRVFFKEDLDCPFRKLDEILEKYKNKKNAAILVDFHAEASSEKTALAWYADGRVTAFWGTHTHIPTADARLLEKGAAYISDVGMTGAYNSVIGENKENIIEAFLSQTPLKHDIAETGPAIVNAFFLEIDNKTSKVKKIKQISIKTKVK